MRKCVSSIERGSPCVIRVSVIYRPLSIRTCELDGSGWENLEAWKQALIIYRFHFSVFQPGCLGSGAWWEHLGVAGAPGLPGLASLSSVAGSVGPRAEDLGGAWGVSRGGCWGCESPRLTRCFLCWGPGQKSRPLGWASLLCCHGDGTVLAQTHPSHFLEREFGRQWILFVHGRCCVAHTHGWQAWMT